MRIRETIDGKGLGYSSEHTYLSNFFPVPLRYEGNLYTSVEHAFQHLKVKDAGDDELAEEMMGLTDPYTIKSIGSGTDTKKSWSLQEADLENHQTNLIITRLRNEYRREAGLPTGPIEPTVESDHTEVPIECASATCGEGNEVNSQSTDYEPTQR